ncbi:hypothetical protein T439DRAFT_35837 [Meredithblackwellia eburnea MCA 4105]
MMRGHLTRCLALIQGFLLLHRKSQRLFARRAPLQYIIFVLATTRASHLSSPVIPSNATVPSPVMLPPSPTPPTPSRNTPTPSQKGVSPQNVNSPAALALAALNTLLCALVDRPRNLRTFEDVGGLSAIVKVLKDKTVAQPARIKAIEVLYYYLLPERPSQRESRSSSRASTSSTSSTASRLAPNPFTDRPELPSLLATATSDFVPQTPVRPRHGHSRHRSKASLSSRSSFEDSGTEGIKEEDGTPKPSRSSQASRPPNDETPRRTRKPPEVVVLQSTANGKLGPALSSPGMLFAPPQSPSETTSTTGDTTDVFSNGTKDRGRSTSPRERTTRTTDEKRELLRTVMPNVEALEHRFEAMGLTGWERDE